MRALYALFLTLLSFAALGQSGLVSGELNVTGIPVNNGNGTFTVVGTFSDPKGLYFAADVTDSMSLWKGNNYYFITAAAANGSQLTLTVQDTYSTGFLPSGVYSIGQETAKLKLPGVSTTGDSNPALNTPPDYAAKLNFILKLIDQGIPGVNSGDGVADTSSVTDPTNGDVFIAGDTLLFYDGDQWITYVVGGGTSLFEYQAAGVGGSVDNGAFVTATSEDLTFARTGGAGQNTEGTITVPAGSILRGVAIHFSAGQAPGNAFYLNVDYTGPARAANGSQNSAKPIWATVASKPATFLDAAPAQSYVHSGTPLQIGIAGIDDNGTRVRVRYKIQNYNQQVGSNPSILSVIFP